MTLGSLRNALIVTGKRLGAHNADAPCKGIRIVLDVSSIAAAGGTRGSVGESSR